MSFDEWKNEYAVQITDLYFDYLKDTNQTKEDCTIIEFAKYMFNQTTHEHNRNPQHNSNDYFTINRSHLCYGLRGE